MFCLRRYDRVPNFPILMAAYTEQVTSIPFNLNGVIASTLFVKSVHTKNRALKMGWKDETSEYNMQVEAQKLQQSKKEAVVETFSAASKPKRKRKK